MLLRWSAGVFNRVVARNVHEGWETLLALLASICSIPAGIHVCIQAIIEAHLIVLDKDRLRRSIHSVVVLRLEQKDSEVRIVALPGIPVTLLLAVIHNLHRNGLIVV